MREPREFPAILNMLYDLTKRLQLLHSAGQVHRDLKPVRSHLHAALVQAALHFALWSRRPPAKSSALLRVACLLLPSVMRVHAAKPVLPSS